MAFSYAVLVALIAVAVATKSVHYKSYPAPAPIPHSTTIDACTCECDGNYYSTLGSNGCSTYTQRTAFLAAQTMACPLGTTFDVYACTCNHVADTVCDAQCPAYKKSSYGYKNAGYCVMNGNTYQQKPKTGCAAFIQSTADLGPVVFNCPAGLTFDLNSCVCDYPAKGNCLV